MFFESPQSVIKKAQQGNKRAWLKLVREHEKSIFNYCLRMLGNPDDAQDLMQETFVSVYRSLPNYRFESSFKTWAIRIAHRRCVEFFRSQKPVDCVEEIEGEVVQNEHTCAEINLLLTQQNKAVVQALAQLSWQQREVVELKFFQQFTFEQIAFQLGLSSNTVKSRLYSALSNLKTEVEILHV